MGCVGILGHAARAQPMQDKLRHGDPWRMSIEPLGGIGQQLVSRVDAQRQRPGAFVELQMAQKIIGRSLVATVRSSR